MRTQLVLALSLVAGCKGTNKEAPVAKPSDDEPRPTGSPRPQRKLSVTVDGKPVEMATALAWKTWDGFVSVTASSVPVGCDEVTGEMRNLHRDEVTFYVELAPFLQPDGSTKPELHRIEQAEQSGPANATGDGTPGQPTTMEVDFTTVSRGKQLTVKGTIDALGCEVTPRKDAPPPPPEQPATITVAGKTYPVRFARFSKDGDTRTVRLFTGAETCTEASFTTKSEITVELMWSKPSFEVDIRGGGRPADRPIELKSLSLGAVDLVRLGGTRIRTDVGELTEKLSETNKLVTAGRPDGPGELDLGNGELEVAKFPVKLEGKVTVTECPN